MKLLHSLLISIVFLFFASTSVQAQVVCTSWGYGTTPPSACPSTCALSTLQVNNQAAWCCGIPTPPGSGNPNPCIDPNTPGATNDAGLSAYFFSLFNQVIFGSSGPRDEFTTPRGLISYTIPYLFTLAGLILFVMVIWGGFEMLVGATNPKAQEGGRERIVNALLGFFILFCSFWLAKIVEIIFGISIL